jgi:hypothetical protein
MRSRPQDQRTVAGSSSAGCPIRSRRRADWPPSHGRPPWVREIAAIPPRRGWSSAATRPVRAHASRSSRPVRPAPVRQATIGAGRVTMSVDGRSPGTGEGPRFGGGNGSLGGGVESGPSEPVPSPLVLELAGWGQSAESGEWNNWTDRSPVGRMAPRRIVRLGRTGSRYFTNGIPPATGPCRAGRRRAGLRRTGGETRPHKSFESNGVHTWQGK